LLEVLAATIIVAVASMTVITYLKSPANSAAHARTTTDELATLLRAARQTAVAKQTSVEVRMMADDGGNWVQSATTGAVPIGTTLVFPLVKPANITLRNWPSRIVFGPTGAADRGLDVYVGTTGHEYRLRLYQGSGIVRVEHP
jgi:Tfp pilus assembly protein FimT